MNLSFIDDFIDFSQLFFVLDYFDRLKRLLTLLWALIRLEQAQYLTVEA